MQVVCTRRQYLCPVKQKTTILTNLIFIIMNPKTIITVLTVVAQIITVAIPVIEAAGKKKG
jgi:threonine/homoserine/homoserine lactone efflux protein